VLKDLIFEIVLYISRHHNYGLPHEVHEDTFHYSTQDYKSTEKQGHFADFGGYVKIWNVKNGVESDVPNHAVYRGANNWGNQDCKNVRTDYE
jgi:hypothetical protein